MNTPTTIAHKFTERKMKNNKREKFYYNFHQNSRKTNFRFNFEHTLWIWLVFFSVGRFNFVQLFLLERKKKVFNFTFFFYFLCCCALPLLMDNVKRECTRASFRRIHEIQYSDETRRWINPLFCSLTICQSPLANFVAHSAACSSSFPSTINFFPFFSILIVFALFMLCSIRSFLFVIIFGSDRKLWPKVLRECAVLNELLLKLRIFLFFFWRSRWGGRVICFLLCKSLSANREKAKLFGQKKTLSLTYTSTNTRASYGLDHNWLALRYDQELRTHQTQKKYEKYFSSLFSPRRNDKPKNQQYFPLAFSHSLRFVGFYWISYFSHSSQFASCFCFIVLCFYRLWKTKKMHNEKKLF